MSQYQENKPAVSIGEWIVTFIILIIPLVNIIMLFVWGFGGSTNPSKANYCKAMLIMAVIGIVLSVLLSLVFGLSFLRLWGNRMW